MFFLSLLLGLLFTSTTHAQRYATGANLTLVSPKYIPSINVEEINKIINLRNTQLLDKIFPVRPPILNAPVIPEINVRQATPARPKLVDWRNRWGVNWLATIQNQWNCNSCWAFAVAGLVESMVRIEHGIWAKRSEGDLRDGIFTDISAAEKKPRDFCTHGGDYIGPLDWIVKNGIADLECWAYLTLNTQAHGGYRPCWDRTGRTVKLPSGYQRLGGAGSLEDQKKWLNSVGPIIAGLDVPNAFMNHQGAGVYVDPLVVGQRWSHSLLIVGYDDDRNAWLVRNSWGVGWGDRGYAWVRYGEMNIDVYLKVGLSGTDPDPWSKRRQHNGNMVATGRFGSNRKNLEIVANRQNGFGVHIVRGGGENNDFSWQIVAAIWATGQNPHPCNGQPTLTESTRGQRNLELLYWSKTNNVVGYGNEQTTTKWTQNGIFGDGKIGGYPSLIQHRPGQVFSSVVRFQDSSLRHYRSVVSSGMRWDHYRVLAGKGVRMSGPSLIQTTATPSVQFGHMYTVAVLDDSSLQFYWFNMISQTWFRGETFGLLIGHTPPVMIQTNAPGDENEIGDFEVFVVFGGRILRWRRDNSDLRRGDVPLEKVDSHGERWTVVETFFSPDGRAKHVWSALQGPFAQNFEVVIELEDGKMQTMFRDWGCNCWKLSIAGGGSVAV
ncbi:hypothetical protein B0J11DRAFT_495590 [Dendryphion nanum]|uniref:Peptidase C1A papain C-terminal domain-containing protein n=1 Tax=Dendryphion nanum TaxID=256645 RepID=A0A9P9DC05_9PLEO|nr:hypothetical protein B0J11DRAFT_495590 [Dendryphion nanum]